MKTHRDSKGRMVMTLTAREESLLEEALYHCREVLGKSSAWTDVRMICTALLNRIAKGGTNGTTTTSKQKTKTKS